VERKIVLSSAEIKRLIDAVNSLRKGVQWKPGKDIVHLNKRRRMGHLDLNATLEDYAKIVFDLVRDGQNVIYLYEVVKRHYYAVTGVVHNRPWIVIFGDKGLMETAFPPIDMENYLERRGFALLGRIDEVLRWKESKS
jgi:hypothetical protein